MIAVACCKTHAPLSTRWELCPCVQAMWSCCLAPLLSWCALACVYHCTRILAKHLFKQVHPWLQAAAGQHKEDADAASPFSASDATPDQAAAGTTSPQVVQSGHRNASGLQSNGSGGTGAKAFQRVKDDEWLGKRGSWSNSYADTFGEAGWGAKASATLQQVNLACLCNELCCSPK